MDKRMTYGGNGAHWDGCEEVHWDCKIAQLEVELATKYEELLNMRNMETDQFNDGFDDARAGKLETDHPHYDLDTDNWRLGYAWGMFEPMKEVLKKHLWIGKE